MVHKESLFRLEYLRRRGVTETKGRVWDLGIKGETA